jgi:hypothetical protein
MAYDTPYQQKDNSGSIFKNERKEQENHPDGKGSALIDGVEYWVSSWNRTSSSGKQFRSLSFQRKEQPASVPQSGYKKPNQDGAKARQLPPQRPASGFDDMDNDVPF